MDFDQSVGGNQANISAQGAVDPLDVYTAGLNRLDPVGDLHQLAARRDRWIRLAVVQRLQRGNARMHQTVV
jgi:hypothetical protein